jgi:hypothetical protein
MAVDAAELLDCLAQRIRLQQQRGRTWRTVQTTPLRATGRYPFGLRPRATGTSGWRIHKASDSDHIGVISRPFRLVVYRVTIAAIHADAAGDDRRNLNGEYVLVRNTGAAAVNLGGWKLDAGDRGQRFSLAGSPLKNGAAVRIHTGPGTTRAGHLYLGSGQPVWDNDGDTAILIDPEKVTMSRYRYRYRAAPPSDIPTPPRRLPTEGPNDAQAEEGRVARGGMGAAAEH